MKRFTKQHGMTLLEVMLALVIMATSGVAVMSAATGALNNQAKLSQKTMALWVASNGLATLKLEKNWPASSWQYKTQTLAGHTWYVRYKTVKVGSDRLAALDIEVSDSKAGIAQAYLRTYVAHE